MRTMIRSSAKVKTARKARRSKSHETVKNTEKEKVMHKALRNTVVVLVLALMASLAVGCGGDVEVIPPTSAVAVAPTPPPTPTATATPEACPTAADAAYLLAVGPPLDTIATAAALLAGDAAGGDGPEAEEMAELRATVEGVLEEIAPPTARAVGEHVDEAGTNTLLGLDHLDQWRDGDRLAIFAAGGNFAVAAEHAVKAKRAIDAFCERP